MTTDPDALLGQATAMAGELTALRRQLHTVPEVGSRLPQTTAVVEEAMAPLGLELHRGEGCDWLAFVLRGDRPGPTVFLRADMDALPVEEASGEPFSSTNGAMHACGHDLHTAGLVGAARLLAARRDELAGTVVVHFQPEEEGPRGSIDCIAEGVMEVSGQHPDAVYGIHVMADQPVGEFRAIAGPTTSGFADLVITIKGQGCHASRPFQGHDPIMTAAEVLVALQAMVTRRFNIFDPVVVTAGAIHAGSASNVIPDECLVRASCRFYSEQSRERLAAEVPVLVRGIAQANGMDADVLFDPQEPPAVNDAAETERALRVARTVFEPQLVAPLPAPQPGSDDVGRYLEQAPGCYAYVGARPADAVVLEANHSPRVRFDDSVLPTISAYLAAVTLDRLAQG